LTNSGCTCYNTAVMKTYNDIQTVKVKVYRDGEIDRWQTLKPHLEELGNKIEYFFVKGHWPKKDEEHI
jgi:hypothetical protein